MSIVRRLWQRMLRPTYFVGTDLEENKYFERLNADSGRSQRTVQYKGKADMWAYVASGACGRRLPVQWSAWLTHTRFDPPTIEELRADLARQQRVQMNAAILEAKEQEERANRDQVAPPNHHPHNKQQSSAVSPHVHMDQMPEPDESQKSLSANPWVEALNGFDKPRSWTPVAQSR